MLSRILQEIRNALRGCLEIALFLKIGITRFEGTIPAFLRSLVVPFLIIPVVIWTVPVLGDLANRSSGWIAMLHATQLVFGIASFMAIVYVLKNRIVTNEDYLRTITAYNWLSVPSYVINIPLILMGHLAVHSWADVSAMMLLVTLYCYCYLAYMLTHSLRTSWIFGITIAMLDFMVGEAVRNIVKYFYVLHM